jgi:hypothetical protein
MGDELPMPDPPLANDVVALRAWSERDVPFIVAACQDRLIERHTAAIPSPYGEADARAWLASQEPARRAGRSLELAIVDASSNEPALGVLRLERLELMIHPENAASQRLAERCGLKREGLLRSHMLKRNASRPLRH